MPIAKSSGSYGGYSVKYRSFLIKYAEIGVKGKNRYLFEDALVKQIHHRLKNLEGKFEVTKEAGRIYAEDIRDLQKRLNELWEMQKLILKRLSAMR